MTRKTRIGLVQLNPVFKKPELSILQANELISSLKPNDLDLLMLPELAFAGYNFRSFDDIQPFSESEVDGISIKWAKETAKRLNCHVLIGFAQKIQELQVKHVYNAMGIVSNTGELLKVYHKTQLYPPVDPLWARPGEGFLAMDLNVARLNGEPGKPVKCCIGICMDLSPDRFEAPFEAYELSSFAVKNNAELLLCSMAWLDIGPQPDPNLTESGKSLEEVEEQLDHWTARCTPIWNLKNRTVAICNRVGVEDEAIFTGISCVLSNSLPDNGEPVVLNYASKHKPELVITDVILPTFYSG